MNSLTYTEPYTEMTEGNEEGVQIHSRVCVPADVFCEAEFGETE